jgi:hypothetical protein
MHILVVGLGGFGTFQSAQDCVAVVAEEGYSMGCWTVTAVDLFLENWRNQTAHGL